MTIGEAEEHRGVEIRGVGRGILAHENGVEGLQRIWRARVEYAEMRLRARHFAAAGMGKPLMA